MKIPMEGFGEVTGVLPGRLESLAKSGSIPLGGVQALPKPENEEPDSLEIPVKSRALVLGAEHRV